MARRNRVTLKKRRRVGFSTKQKYWFDKAAAQKWVDFIQLYCRHTKGEWAGQLIVLEPWQQFMVEEFFGWKRKNAKTPAECTRQYRTLWLEIPRKNTKSTISACIALGLILVDGEPGAEVYGAAGDRDQAGIVFDAAKAMRDMEPQIIDRTRVYGGQGGHKRSIVAPKSGSFYRVISRDAFTKHGFNSHGIVVDEVHVQRSRDLIDTLRTSMGARRQPVEVYITTAGTDRNSICWEMHEYALKIIDGVLHDDTFLPFIYAASEKDDWTSPKIWAKANPNLGLSPKLEYIEQECKRARQVPGYQNVFKRLHLNIWTEQASRWLDIARWDGCGAAVDTNALAGLPCYAGLDLASKTDIAAYVLVFNFDTGEVRRVRVQGGDEDDYTEFPIFDYHVVPYFWIPEEKMRERVEQDDLREVTDRVNYRMWVDQGHIKATSGNIIDYDVIRHDINEIAERYNTEEIAVDPWNATQLTTQLEGDGFEVVPFRQGYASMTAPTKELEAAVLSRHLRHGGNPVLRWMASNVAVDEDPAGNLKPSKKSSGEKIDGIVALIMGIGRIMANAEDDDDSWISRGVITA